MSLSFIDVTQKSAILIVITQINSLYVIFWFEYIMDSNFGFEYDIAFMCSKKCYQNKFLCLTSRSIIKWDVTFKVDW